MQENKFVKLDSLKKVYIYINKIIINNNNNKINLFNLYRINNDFKYKTLRIKCQMY